MLFNYQLVYQSIFEVSSWQSNAVISSLIQHYPQEFTRLGLIYRQEQFSEVLVTMEGVSRRDSGGEDLWLCGWRLEAVICGVFCTLMTCPAHKVVSTGCEQLWV